MDGNLIEDIVIPFEPYNIYKKGDFIFLNVKVHSKKFWSSKEDLSGEYLVVDVKRFISTDYWGYNINDANCTCKITASVKLEKIN